MLIRVCMCVSGSFLTAAFNYKSIPVHQEKVSENRSMSRKKGRSAIAYQPCPAPFPSNTTSRFKGVLSSRGPHGLELFQRESPGAGWRARPEVGGWTSSLLQRVRHMTRTQEEMDRTDVKEGEPPGLHLTCARFCQIRGRKWDSLPVLGEWTVPSGRPGSWKEETAARQGSGSQAPVCTPSQRPGHTQRQHLGKASRCRVRLWT